MSLRWCAHRESRSYASRSMIDPRTFLTSGPPRPLPRPRRDIALRLHPGRGDLGDLLHLRREHSISNQEHVRAETGTLRPSPALSHDAGSHHRPDTGNSPDSDHHVVELERGILGKGRAELEGGRILGADDAAYETHWISLLTRARLL